MLAAPLSAGAIAPPLRTSPNVEHLANIPGSAAGIVFRGNHAYVTGWLTGLTVLDVSQPASPRVAAVLPLPHFENEDVEVCGDTLLISNDREREDFGAVLFVIDISQPAAPALTSLLPLGWTGTGVRGAGHIANFVKRDCSLAWVDGGEQVEVVDLRDRANPKSLGRFTSEASKSEAFTTTHDSTLDADGTVWNVGGGGVAHYRLTSDPLKPQLIGSSSKAGTNPSPWNDFILHNAARHSRDSRVLLVTEEDYVDQDEAQPGSCHGQGKFETWSIRPGKGRMTPITRWQTELNGFLAGGDAQDSKAPFVANCSSHWFEERDGIVAMAWYEQGLRVLDVRDPKRIRQIGYHLPSDGATWGAYWVPNARDLIYTADVTRGIDVFRVKAGGTGASRAKTVAAPILDAWRRPTALSTFRPSARFGWSCPIPA